MIAIFEGIDGTGKTTLIKEFLKETDEFILYEPEKPTGYKDKNYCSMATSADKRVHKYEFPQILKGEYEGFMKIGHHLSKNLAMDRFHLSEYVYSRACGNTPDMDILKKMDDYLNVLGAVIILCTAPLHIIARRTGERSDNPVNLLSSIEEYEQLYKQAIGWSALPVIEINTYNHSINECLHKLRRALITRQSWNRYFMDLAFQVRSRSTCARRKVGAVIVKQKSIMSTGYNGSVVGADNCMYLDKCIRTQESIKSGERSEYTMASHAEANAIAQAAKHGINIDGSIMYVTNQPCFTCYKLIMQSGIREVFYRDEYRDPVAEKYLHTFNLKVKRI